MKCNFIANNHAGFIEASLCKIQGFSRILKDYPTAFKDYKIMIYTMIFNFANAEIIAREMIISIKN